MNFKILLADVLLVIHTAFIAFVVVGQVLIFLGLLLRWKWVRNFWFRAAHLLGITIVVVQSWLGIICPLTTWEGNLRRAAGHDFYEGSFVRYWTHRLIYYEIDASFFVPIYTVFGALVILTWVFCRPQLPRRAKGRIRT